MRIASGRNVSFYRTGPLVDRAIDIIDELYVEMFGFELTITSCREGDHSEVSKHYLRAWDDTRWPKNPDGSQGAFDCRTWAHPKVWSQMLPAKKRRLRDEAKKRLDAEMPGRWDVVVETFHMHCEDDPKD